MAGKSLAGGTNLSPGPGDGRHFQSGPGSGRAAHRLYPGSVLGATEPLTAVLVGILVFEEASTLTVWCGVALVCLSVAVVMLGPQWLRRSPAPDGGTQS